MKVGSMLSFLVYLLLVLYTPQANGNCYSECEKVFTLHTLMLPLCNNSVILTSNLNIMNGLQGSLGGQWYLPNGLLALPSSQLGISSSSVFADGSQLKIFNSQSHEFTPGVYTYLHYGTLTMIGIYATTDNAFKVDVKASLIIDNYFNQSSFKLDLVCITENYPPTCVTWFRNANLYANYTSNSTEVISNTSTIYNIKVSVPPIDIVGMHLCSVFSNGSIQHNNSDSVFIEGVPPILIHSYQLISPDALEVTIGSNVAGSSSYMIHYKEIDAEDTNTSLCNNFTLSCTMHELCPDTTYSFVISIVNEESSDIVYLPTQPYLITIKVPEPINHTSIAVSLIDQGVVHVEWEMTLLQNSIVIRYSASCQLRECSSGVIVNNFSNSSLLSNLVDGLSYTLSFTSVNVLGNSTETEFSIIQNRTAPNVPVIVANDGNSFNSSSFTITWEPVSCCNASGESPSYHIILNDDDDDTILYNVTVSPDTTWYTFTGLKPRGIYSVTIRAVNSFGSGPETVHTTTIPMVTTTDITVATTNETTGFTDEPTDSLRLPTMIIILIVASCSALFIIIVAACIIILCMVTVLTYRLKKRKSTRSTDHKQISMNLLDVTSPVYSPFKSEKSQAPYVIEFPANTKAVEGETVHLLVQVSGQPEPTYTWTHQGEPLQSSSDHKVQIFSDGTLVIRDIEQENAGQYNFSARNIGGVLNRVVILTVLPGIDDEEQQQIQEAKSLIIDHKPIPADTLEKYVEMQHLSDNKPFNVLFSSLIRDTDHSLSIANANRAKNRYKNIIPYDDNMIALQPIDGWDEFQGQYINASYINGYNSKNKFIATQGPLLSTTGDLWRMIWQEKSHVIVMLTNVIEGNRVKSEAYWPPSPDNELQFGPFVIKVASEEEAYANFVIRSFEILLTDATQARHYVKQFQFTAWPDHGVPDHGSPLVIFMQKVMHYHAQVGGPIVTHCSAGVGRTGTFIGLDIGLEQMKSENQIDFIQIVNQLREQRMHMVQTISQFIFLHDTLLEQILCGNTLIPVAQFSEIIGNFDYTDCKTKKTIYETQYQLVKRLTPKTTAYKCDVGRGFIDRNRPDVLLPSDTRRVVLQQSDNDYINASYVDGYQKKKEFIIAQSPLEQTTLDFWKMIIQHKTSTILMLCNLSEDSKMVCHQYWPNGLTATIFNYISVKLINEVQESGSIIRRTFGIKDMNSGYCSTVVQLQLTNWLPDGQCANYSTIGDLYALVTDNQRRNGSNKPVVVHCSDSITRSAMYCVTHNAIEQAKLEQGSDLFQIVKTLRMQRPGSIPSQKCYETLHELVSFFLSNFAMYSQFQ